MRENEILLDSREAAKALRKKPNTLEKWRVQGKGPLFVKVGDRAVAYRRIDIETFIARNVRSSTSQT